MKKLKRLIIQISILAFMLIGNIESNAATVDFAIENFKIRDNALGYEVDELHIGRMYYLEFKLVNYSSASASTAGIAIVGGTVKSNGYAEPYIYEVLDGVTLASKASKTYKYYFTPTSDFMDLGTQFAVGATALTLSSDTDKNSNNNTMNTEIPMVNHAYEDFRIQSATIKDATTNEVVTGTITGKEYYVEVEIKNNSKTLNTLEHIGLLISDSSLLHWDYVYNTVIQPGKTKTIKQYFTASKTVSTSTDVTSAYIYLPNDCYQNDNELTITVPFRELLDFALYDATIRDAVTDREVEKTYVGKEYYVEVTVKNNSSSDKLLDYVMLHGVDGAGMMFWEFVNGTTIASGRTGTIKYYFTSSSQTVTDTDEISIYITLPDDHDLSNNETVVSVPFLSDECMSDFEFVNYAIKDAQTHEVSTRGIKNRDYYLEIEIKNNCTCGEEHYYGGSGIIMDEDGTPYIMAMTDPVYIESGGTYFDKFYFNMYDDEWYPDSANLSIVLFALEPDIDNSNNEVDDFYWSYGTEYVDFGIVSAIVRSAATDEIVTQTYTGEDYYIDFEIENNSDTEETLEHIGFLGSDSDLIFWDYLENITIKNGENYIGKYYFTSSKTAGSNDNLMGIYLYLPDDGDAQNNEFTIALPFGTRYSDFSVDNITVKDSRSGNVVYELYAGRDYYFEVTITNHSNDSSNNIVPSLYIMAGFEDDEHSSPDSIIYTTDEYIVESGTTETFIFDFKAITSYPIISSSRLDITALINTSGAIKEDQNVSNNEMTIEVPLLGVLGIELTYSLSTNGDTNSPITITYKPSSTSGPIKGVKLPDGSTVNKSSGTYSVSKNGTYTFVAFDEFGYTYEMNVVIDTIDYGKPTIILKNDPNSEWVNQDVTVTIEYSDT